MVIALEEAAKTRNIELNHVYTSRPLINTTNLSSRKKPTSSGASSVPAHFEASVSHSVL